MSPHFLNSRAFETFYANFELGEGRLSASHLGERKHERITVNSPAPTPQQQRAISARGNVLVVAGAGAGKTQTVVDRCLAWLLDEAMPAPVDQILMVTFTEAAAAEMRQRLPPKPGRGPGPIGQIRFAIAPFGRTIGAARHGPHKHPAQFLFPPGEPPFLRLGVGPERPRSARGEGAAVGRQSLDLVLDKTYASETPSAFAIQQPSSRKAATRTCRCGS